MPFNYLFDADFINYEINVYGRYLRCGWTVDELLSFYNNHPN